MIESPPEGYWYCRPNVTMRYSPLNKVWWIEIIDSNNNQIYIGNVIEGIDNNTYEHNGFMYKRLASFSCDDEMEAIAKYRMLCSLVNQFKKNEVEIFTEKVDIEK